MINWILAILGILIFFIAKYKRRNRKYKDFSITFWVADNWEESIIAVFATIALMLIFMSPEAQFNINPFIDKLPFITALPIKMVISLAIGLGNTALLYKMFQNKKK